MRIVIIHLMLIFMVSGWNIAVYGQVDSLGRYLEIAGQNNPAVKAAFHTYEAALQKIPQMGALEDPRLDMGFFLQPMEIVSGRQIAQIQLMQMFPWFGVRKAARTEAQHMAQMAFEAFRETRDNLYLEVYTQWYILCGLVQKQNNNDENKKLLYQLETLALQRFSSGTGYKGTVSGAPEPVSKNAPAMNNMSNMNSMPGMNKTGGSPANSNSQSNNQGGSMGMDMNNTASGMSEVLRIQMEKVELESNIESVRSEIAAGKIRFNALLNRPPESEVVLPDELSQIPFSFDIEAILSMITEQNPMLGMVREETLAYAARLEMEKKMAYPMFGIGLQYMLIEKKTENSHEADGSMKNMNGKDMLMPMVSVSIPIYRNKYKAAQKENVLLQQAGEEKYADTFNRLRAELYQFKFQLDDAERKIMLYRQQTALIRSIYELKLSEFLTGKSDLGAVIQIQRQLLDYQLKESDATVDYNTLVANIMKVISN